MKQLVYILPIIVLLLSVKTGAGQSSYDSWTSLSTESNSLKSKIEGNRFYHTPMFRGSYFYHSDWLKGTVTLENEEVFENLDVKLNSLLDELVYYNPRIAATIIIDKEKIKKFKVTGKNGVVEEYDKIQVGSLSDESRYYRKIYDGNKSLYVWYRTFEIKTSHFMDAKNVMRNTEFILSKEYYVYFPEKGFHRLQANRKSLFDLFPDSKKEIKKALRRNKIFGIDAEDQMVKVFVVLGQEGILEKS